MCPFSMYEHAICKAGFQSLMLDHKQCFSEAYKECPVLFISISRRGTDLNEPEDTRSLIEWNEETWLATVKMKGSFLIARNSSAANELIDSRRIIALHGGLGHDNCSSYYNAYDEFNLIWHCLYSLVWWVCLIGALWNIVVSRTLFPKKVNP